MENDEWYRYRTGQEICMARKRTFMTCQKPVDKIPIIHFERILFTQVCYDVISRQKVIDPATEKGLFLRL